MRKTSGFYPFGGKRLELAIEDRLTAESHQLEQMVEVVEGCQTMPEELAAEEK